MPSLFISYSQDSALHMKLVRLLANQLRADGIDAFVDQYEPNPDEGWVALMNAKIRDADYVLIMCTEPFYRRAEGIEEPGKGLGAMWENKLIMQAVYDAGGVNKKFIPAFFGSKNRAFIPTYLKGYTHYELSKHKNYKDLMRHLLNQPEHEVPPLGNEPELITRKAETLFGGAENAESAEPSQQSPDPGRQDVLMVYSVADKPWADRLTTHMAPYRHKGLLKTYDPQEALPGDLGQKDLMRALSQVQVALVLVTPAFMAEDELFKQTLPQVLKQQSERGLRIFWLAVKPAPYELTGLTDFVAANDKQRPLSTLPEHEQDEALVKAVRNLGKCLDV